VPNSITLAGLELALN